MSSIEYVLAVDECGAGAMAGPLVVSAVAFRADAKKVTTEIRGPKGPLLLEVKDSKKVKNPEHRAALEQAIKASCVARSCIERSSSEIDQKLMRTALQEATELAISRCLELLLVVDKTVSPRGVIVLVDGDGQEPKIPCPVRMIPHGDETDWRIGAASICAKATHDVRISFLHERYPAWGFDSHRGYATRAHKAMLKETGPIPGVHRMSYAPVRATRGTIPGFEE